MADFQQIVLRNNPEDDVPCTAIKGKEAGLRSFGLHKDRMEVEDFHRLDASLDSSTDDRALEPMRPGGRFEGELDILRRDRGAIFPLGRGVQRKPPPLWTPFPFSRQRRNDIVMFITGDKEGQMIVDEEVNCLHLHGVNLIASPGFHRYRQLLNQGRSGDLLRRRRHGCGGNRRGHGPTRSPQVPRDESYEEQHRWQANHGLGPEQPPSEHDSASYRLFLHLYKYTRWCCRSSEKRAISG